MRAGDVALALAEVRKQWGLRGTKGTERLPIKPASTCSEPPSLLAQTRVSSMSKLRHATPPSPEQRETLVRVAPLMAGRAGLLEESPSSARFKRRAALSASAAFDAAIITAGQTFVIPPFAQPAATASATRASKVEGDWKARQHIGSTDDATPEVPATPETGDVIRCASEVNDHDRRHASQSRPSMLRGSEEHGRPKADIGSSPWSCFAMAVHSMLGCDRALTDPVTASP